MKTYPTREEDIALIRAAQAGDIPARDTLVTRHLGFIYTVIAKSIMAHEDRDEYLGCAVTAYIRSIMAFRFHHKTRLNSYAELSMMREVWRARSKQAAIYVPQGDEETKARNAESRAQARRIVSIHGKGDDRRGACQIPDAGNMEAIEQADELDLLRRCVRLLDAKTRAVLRHRNKGLTFEEVGARMGIGRASAQTIDAKAKRTLRAMFEERGVIVSDAEAA